MNWEIIHIDETDSTNNWLELHKRNRPFCVNTAVWTDYQTAGRGCGTNSWESEHGKNLLFSLLTHPTDIPASRQFVISQWISIALCETLERYIQKKVQIKWPNDIYVEDKKIAGILIENTLHGGHIKDSIIGIGLNVNQREFHSDAPNPVSLCQLLGHEVDKEALLHEFLLGELSVPPVETISSPYGNRLYRKGLLATYEDHNGRFQATLIDVEPDGRLILRDEDGQERRYAFKEVTFIL